MTPKHGVDVGRPGRIDVKLRLFGGKELVGRTGGSAHDRIKDTIHQSVNRTMEHNERSR